MEGQSKNLKKTKLCEILLTDINHVSYNMKYGVFPYRNEIALLNKVRIIILNLGGSTNYYLSKTKSYSDTYL